MRARIALTAALALCWPIAAATAQSAKATYDTEQAGPLTLEFGKDGVTGEYPEYSGKLRGTLKGTDRIEGNWWQSKGTSDDVKCGTEMNGTVYWGKFVLIENSDQKGFHGLWGSCDEEPSEAWTGTLKQ